jgi:hypothetical protein
MQSMGSVDQVAVAASGPRLHFRNVAAAAKRISAGFPLLPVARGLLPSFFLL